MPTPKKPDPAPPALTVAERRAQKIARSEARRAARRWDVSNHPPCGPVYVVLNAPACNEAELTNAET